MTNPAAARWSDIVGEADDLVRTASARGLDIRLLGSAGIRLHCPDSAQRMDQLDRATKDVDIVIRKEHRSGVRSLLAERGYQIDRDMLVAMEGQRFLYHHPELALQLDVFVDRLEFCHTLDVRERMGQHPVTLPVDDLVLSKTQIVELTPNDLKDLVTLFSAHEVDETAGGGAETIDGSYVGRVLGRDWGFHHTVTRNLDRLRSAISDGAVGVGSADRPGLISKVARLADAIERAEKTMKWRMRARVGERVQWFADVHEPEATY